MNPHQMMEIGLACGENLAPAAPGVPRFREGAAAGIRMPSPAGGGKVAEAPARGRMRGRVYVISRQRMMAVHLPSSVSGQGR